MKTPLRTFNGRLTAALLTMAGLFLVAGCASHLRAPSKSGFLMRYNHLTKVDDTTWRYVDTNRVGNYSKFQITSAKVLATQFDGKPITPEAQQRAAEYLRQALTKALMDRYPIVTAPGTDVGEIRVAITDIYKTGPRVGLTIEGEINDSYSTVQLAAVMRTELGDAYLGSWWDAPSARLIVDAWAARVRQAIDHAHGR